MMGCADKGLVSSSDTNPNSSGRRLNDTASTVDHTHTLVLCFAAAGLSAALQSPGTAEYFSLHHCLDQFPTEGPGDSFPLEVFIMIIWMVCWISNFDLLLICTASTASDVLQCVSGFAQTKHGQISDFIPTLTYVSSWYSTGTLDEGIWTIKQECVCVNP